MLCYAPRKLKLYSHDTIRLVCARDPVWGRQTMIKTICDFAKNMFIPLSESEMYSVWNVKTVSS